MLTYFSYHVRSQAVTYGLVTLLPGETPRIHSGQCLLTELRDHLEPHSYGPIFTHDTNVLQGLRFAHDSHPLMQRASEAAQALDWSIPAKRPDRSTRLWIHADAPGWALSCGPVTAPLSDLNAAAQALRNGGRTEVEIDAILRGAQQQMRVWIARSDKSKCLEVGKLIMQATAEDHAEHARALLKIARNGTEIPTDQALLRRLQNRPLHTRNRAWPLHALGEWTDQRKALEAAQQLAANGQIILAQTTAGPAAKLP